MACPIRRLHVSFVGVAISACAVAANDITPPGPRSSEVRGFRHGGGCCKVDEGRLGQGDPSSARTSHVTVAINSPIVGSRRRFTAHVDAMRHPTKGMMFSM